MQISSQPHLLELKLGLWRLSPFELSKNQATLWKHHTRHHNLQGSWVFLVAQVLYCVPQSSSPSTAPHILMLLFQSLPYILCSAVRAKPSERVSTSSDPGSEMPLWHRQMLCPPVSAFHLSLLINQSPQGQADSNLKPCCFRTLWPEENCCSLWAHFHRTYTRWHFISGVLIVGCGFVILVSIT